MQQLEMWIPAILIRQKVATIKRKLSAKACSVWKELHCRLRDMKGARNTVPLPWPGSTQVRNCRVAAPQWGTAARRSLIARRAGTGAPASRAASTRPACAPLPSYSATITQHIGSTLADAATTQHTLKSKISVRVCFYSWRGWRQRQRPQSILDASTQIFGQFLWCCLHPVWTLPFTTE